MIEQPNENPDLEKVIVSLEKSLEVKDSFTNKDVFQTVMGIATDSKTNI